MASGIGKPLRLRLFLEGQEVPVVAASITIGLNAPASASIQVLPLDQGMELKPRTMVHLFFLDQLPSDVDVNAAKQQGISEDLFRLSYYKLLFSGEIVGFAFSQTPMSRGLVFQCLDFSSYWDAAHATAMEYGPGGNAFYNQSSVYAANAALFDDIVNFQSEKIVSWLRQTPLTPGLQQVSGLAGGVIRMLEAIGGVPTHHKGVNDFFTFAELRCRLMAQLTAEEKDNTASRLFSGKVFDEWVRNGLQNIGQQVTFRDMLKLLCQYIYYDTVPNPAAKFDPATDGSSEKTVTSSSLTTNPLSIKVRADLVEDKTDLSSALTSTLAAQQRVAVDTAAALRASSKSLNPIGSQAKTLQSEIEVAARTLDGMKQPNAVAEDIFKKAQGEIDTAILVIDGDEQKIVLSTGVNSSITTARLRTQILRPDCFFAPAPRCNVIFPEHFAQVAFDRSFLSEVTRSLTMVYDTLIGRDQMLADKIMAPNIGLDMAKIQKQVGDSGYRILMPHERHTGIIPRSEWLPNTAAFDKSTGSAGDKLRGARLSWGNRAALFHFFKYRFGPRRVNIAGKFNPYVVCGFPGVVILKPFIPDLAKVREALKIKEADPVNSTDKTVLDVIQTNGTTNVSLGAPFQLLGMIGNVSHSIDQTGGTTSISMHHARRHLGSDDEFVGLFSETTGTVKRRIRVPLTYDKAIQQKGSKDRDSLLKVLVDVTPQSATVGGGTATASEQSTPTVTYPVQTIDPQAQTIITTLKSRTVSQSTETKKTTNTDPVNANGRIDGLDRNVSIPKPPGKLTSGSNAQFGAKGTILGVEVVDPTIIPVTEGTFKGKKVFRAVVLHESVEITSTDLAPVEEIIRPSWFSPNYSNPKIGDNIYKLFFGTTSIIDQLRFTGLVADAIVTTDDPEGDTFEPTQAFQEIQKSLSDNQKTRTRLTIERAINVIAYFYGLVRTNGKDVDSFLRQYSERPIATMVDILGSSDLQIDYDSKGKPSIKQGVPGFHSLALDRKAIEKGNLTGLLDDPDKPLPRINNAGKKEPVSPVYDIRKEKLVQVDAYVQAIRLGPGFRG